ncbi:MAG TPA: hypothetical protein PLR20_07735 [Syntrophales bacterium]|nr:hypothetical protein [Syntrophales bacterium]HOX93350.1 hypothetical protein [Syntrophales bacterium]HPI56551.1 hypothetical protein [Syntrophales bacterium]HPN25028.1 hypothetical protein [Syntrophales bacterium]HQM29229.1 hypothetical protein [Syntrophales bacterium]
MTKSTGQNIFLVFVLAALAGLVLAAMPPGLSSNEEAIHYVQMKNFVVKGSLEIDAPAFSLGFGAEDVAGPRGFIESRDGRLYAVAPPIFPRVASFFYRLLGERAVDFTPVLFLFLSVLVLGLILDRLMNRGVLYYLLLAAFLLGSPVFIQGFLFSGMTLALFLIVSALWLLVSHFGDHPAQAKLFGASALMGASVLVRVECLPVVLSFYLCGAFILAAQKRTKDLRTILAGLVVSIAMLVLHDLLIHGRFPGSYFQLFLPLYALSPIRAAVLGGALIASCVMYILSLREGFSAGLRAVLSVLTVVICLIAITATAARISLYHLLALFPAVLFVFFGVPALLERLKKREGTLEGILTATVVLCLVLGAAILRPGEWVVFTIWVPMIPLVILLIAMNREAVFVAEGMSLVLTFFIGVALVNGIQESRETVLKYRSYNAARIEFIARNTAAGDAVLFSDIGSRDHTGPLFFDRVFLVTKGPDDEERLVRRLHERGIDRIYEWTTNPMSVRGFNPYSGESPPAFPFPSGTKSCCSGNCREGSYFLVRLDARTHLSAGFGRKGS